MTVCLNPTLQIYLSFFSFPHNDCRLLLLSVLFKSSVRVKPCCSHCWPLCELCRTSSFPATLFVHWFYLCSFWHYCLSVQTIYKLVPTSCTGVDVLFSHEGIYIQKVCMYVYCLILFCLFHWWTSKAATNKPINPFCAL